MGARGAAVGRLVAAVALGMAVLAAWAAAPGGSAWAAGGPDFMPPRPGTSFRPPQALIDAERAMDHGTARARGGRGPVTTGTRHIVVLCAGFTDQAGTVAPSSFHDLLFSIGVLPTLSMREYYAANSYDRVDVVGDVFPAGSAWIDTGMTRAAAWNGGDCRALIERVVQLADPHVDFAQYDDDGDHTVDGLFVVHSGPGQEYSGDPDDIWSHRWALETPYLTQDGVSVSGYSTEPEYWSSPGDMTMGVYAHEGGHLLFDLEDLYDYGTDGTQSAGVGDWDLMSYGSWGGDNGDQPAGMCAFEKVGCGWVTPVEPARDGTSFVLRPAESYADCLKVPAMAPSGSQYYLIENRQRIRHDADLPGAGVLIWHIDEAITSGRVNDNEWYPGRPESQHFRVALEQADGLWGLEHASSYGDAGDAFGNGVSLFTGSSSPGSRGYEQSYAVSNLTSIAPLGGGDYTVTVWGGPNDLSVTQLTASPASLGLGGPVELRATVRNNGAAPIHAGTAPVAFWTHRASAPTTGAGAAATVALGETLAPGGSTEVSYTFTPPATGAFTAWALVDPASVTPEEVRDNNAASAGYEAHETDLVVSALTIAPEPTTLGAPLTAEIRVRNAGAVDYTSDFQVGLWQHRASRPSGLGDASSTYTVTGGLAAGAEIVVASGVSFTPAAAGTYRAWAYIAADPLSDDTSNNATDEAYHVLDRADLTTSVTIGPNPSALGAELTARVVVRNAGQAAYAGAVDVGFWPDAAEAPTSLAGAARTWTFTDLAGGSETPAFTFTFTPSALGTFTGRALALPRVAGAEEATNNAGECGYLVAAPPNLVISRLEVTPASAEPGTALTASVEVRNTGAISTGAPCQIAFWPNRPTQPASGPGDVTWTLPALAGGAVSGTFTHTWTPDSEGGFTAWATADVGGAITEADETDNTVGAPHTVGRGADLLVSQLTVTPRIGSFGGEVAVALQVANTGAFGFEGPFRIGLWSHRETAPTSLDGADATWRVEGGLAGGAATSTYRHRFAAAETGARSVWVLIVPEAAASEPAANNALAAPYTVTAPDLSVSVEIAPSVGTVGGALTARIVCRNLGNGAVGPFHLGLWRAHETAPAATDAPDESWALAGLAADAQTSVEASLPADTAGSYRAWSRVTTDTAGVEPNTENNAGSTAYEVVTRAVRGRVTLAGRPLEGVALAAGQHSGATDAAGDYVVTGFIAGAVTLRPTLAGYEFEPAERTVAIGEEDAVRIDFIAHRVLEHRYEHGGLALMAVPADPLGKSPPEILSAPGLASRIWSPEARTYRPLAGPPAVGQGFWSRVPAGGATARVAGDPASDDQYPIALAPGWNMVGNPFLTPIDWAATHVDANGAWVPLADAVEAGWIEAYAWVYGPDTGYVLVHPTIPGARTEIAPWEGFCVYAHRALRLVVHPASSGVEAAAATARGATGGFALNLVAESACAVDGFNLCGVLPPGARAGAASTVAEPPAPGRSLQLGYVDPSGAGLRSVDLREQHGREWTWELVVRSGEDHETIRVGCADTRALPREYDALLTDAETGRSVSLRSGERLRIETVEAGESHRLRFTIRARGAGLRVAGLEADALVRGGAMIAYTLSAPARVAVEVLNAAGRVVGVLGSGELLAPGPRTVRWSGRGPTGTALPAGEYVVRLTAESELGERASAMTRMTYGGGG